MIMGSHIFKRTIKGKNRMTVERKIRNTFRKPYSVRIPLARTFTYKGGPLYGFINREKLDIIVYDYPSDGKRLWYMTKKIRKIWAKAWEFPCWILTEGS